MDNSDLGRVGVAETGSRPADQAPTGLAASRFDPARDPMVPRFNRWQGVRHIDATGEFAAFVAGYADGMVSQFANDDNGYADLALRVEPPADAAMSRDARWGYDYARQRIADAIRSGATVTSNTGCRNCAGEGWVCENHLDTPWRGGEPVCCRGAGSPCPVCQPEMANAPLIYSIAQEARRYAAFYPEGSDGRNTFIMFAEFVETRSIAQAIETRRAATGTGAVHESAVCNADAPTPSSEPHHDQP